MYNSSKSTCMALLQKDTYKKNTEEKGLYWFCVYRKVNKLCKKCQQAHSTHIFLKKKNNNNDISLFYVSEKSQMEDN